VLTDVMARGTTLGIATSLDDHNKPLIDALGMAAEEAGLVDKLYVVRRQHLHIKGVLLKRGILTGSMNLTYNGLELNDEMVVYDTTPKTLAEARINFESYVGTGA
jgi:phosphatidylserine/phosphatidylglycerophosphate/cardiolipin synthase-like enzyme